MFGPTATVVFLLSTGNYTLLPEKPQIKWSDTLKSSL